MFRTGSVAVCVGWRKANDPAADLAERRPCTETLLDFLQA
jgi:hypothetical protein